MHVYIYTTYTPLLVPPHETHMMSYVTYMNESFHPHDRVVSLSDENNVTLTAFSHLMSHTSTSFVTCTKESCLK